MDKASSLHIAFGCLIAAGLFLIALAATGALLLEGRGFSGAPTAFSAIVKIAGFTFYQASLSAFLAVIIAIPVARSVWRRALTWKSSRLISLTFLSIVMPTTVAAAGLLGVWGQNGAFSQLVQFLGYDRLPPIYGLGAVLLAHVFFNAPLVMRILMSVLASVPAAHWRLAAQWGLTDWQRFIQIEWPLLRRVIPGAFGLVFLLCFTSFSLVLMLGGGPSVTTLEVSIYTALRFEFDLPKAAMLSLLQLCICAVVVAVLARLQATSFAGAPAMPRSSPAQRGDEDILIKFWDAIVLIAFLLLVVAPIITVFWRGMNENLMTVLRWQALHRAALTSVSIAMISGVAATCLALVMAAARIRLRTLGQWAMDVSVSLYLAVSAIVLGTGLFILLRGLVDVFFIAPLLVVLSNMLVALPFAYRILEARMAVLASQHDRLSAGFGISGWRRFRYITLPSMVPELGFATGLSAALSMGDLTVIALFGSQQFQTLPWLLYQTMARYRSEDADALALILLLVTVALFLIAAYGWRLARRR